MAVEDRRRAPRIDKRFMVKYRCPSLGHAQWMMSPIKDLSAVGLRFVGEFAFARGTDIELQIILPILQEPLPARGVIVWQRPASAPKTYEHGVEFSDSDPAVFEQLSQAVDHFLRKAPGAHGV